MKKLIVSIAAIMVIALGCMARQPQRGYRGFIEWSNDLRSEYALWFDGKVRKENLFYTGVSTSHGYQFNPWIFLGGGLMYEKCNNYDRHMQSPFVHGRTDLKFGSFTPFGDVRLGYNLSDGGGVYYSQNIGYRFNWGRKMGVNLGLGLTLQGYKYDVVVPYVTPEGYNTLTTVGNGRNCNVYFSFRVGIDF